jgi:XTP/dITP diphosphohydrolase
MRICFATNNQHKIREVWQVLPPDFSLLSLTDIGCREELEESQSTMEGNSLQKADYVFRKYNVPCFADDSGLEVDALDGAPGVYSARYAGPQRNDDDNIRLLLTRLAGNANRKARFRTVITLVGFSDSPLVFEGIINGTIAATKSGSNGFGYDPVFKPEGNLKTFAEMELAEKNSVSHRAKAVDLLIRFLRSLKGQ